MNVEREIPRTTAYNYREDPSASSVVFRDVLHRLYPDSENRQRFLDRMQFNDSDKVHIKKSRSVIEQTARRVFAKEPGVPKKALILGSGYCMDIPLETLVSNFDEVTLVELFAGRTQGAVEELPPEQQKKITIVRADITGSLAGIVEDLASVEASSTDSSKFLIGMKKVFQKAQATKADVDVGSGYDFVSSQLLASQLSAVSTAYTDAVLRNTFCMQPEGIPGGVENKAIVEEGVFEDLLYQKHLEKLRKVVSPNGLVHFADTTIGPNVPLLTGISQLFTAKHVDSWEWQGTNAMRWDVHSYVLTPIGT